MVFPPVRLLLAQQIPKKRRIEDIIQMLIRMLLFSLLAFMFARPFVKGGAVTGVSNTAITIDASPSMSGCDTAELMGQLKEAMPYLEKGKSNAIYLCASLPVKIKDESEVHFFNSPEDPPICLEALSMYENLIFVSDFRGPGWKSVEKRSGQVEGSQHVFLVQAKGCRNFNAWIEKAEIHKKGRGGKELIQIEVATIGDVSPENAEISFVNEKQNPVTVTLNPVKKGEFYASVPFPTGSKDILHIHLPFSDGVLLDNHFYIPLSQKGGIRNILIYNGEPSEIPIYDEAYFLINAVRTDGRLWAATKISMDAGEVMDQLKKNATVVLLNSSPTDFDMPALEKAVKNGGVTIFAPGDRTGEGERFAGIIIGRKAVHVPPQYLTVTQEGMKYFHPSQGLITALSKVEVRRSLEIYPEKPPFEILLSLSDGSPALIRLKTSKSIVFAFAFPLDLEWSDFAVSPSFLPVLLHILRHPEYHENVLAEDELTMVTRGPGVYTRRDGTYEIVNPDLSDSKLEKVEPENILPRIKNAEIVKNLKEALRKSVRTSSTKKHLDEFFILFLLCICAVEFFLSGRKP